MIQDILTWIIVGVCVAAAVVMIARRFRGRGKSCDCGCGDNSCKPSGDACSGCAVADLCKNPKKK